MCNESSPRRTHVPSNGCSDTSGGGDRQVAAAVASIVAAVHAVAEMLRCSNTRAASIGLDGRLEVPRDEIEEQADRVPPKVRRGARGGGAQHRESRPPAAPPALDGHHSPGVSVEQRVTPLDRVGCYVPGGRYPLPSSLLMTAIPARAAGVREIIVACPKPAPVVMAAAREAGVTRLFRMGGAQAIAALAYGTKTVPRVDKIVGPGNRYVAAAKALVATDCAIDFYAGPTEIVIVSDKGNPEWIAADLIAQAEHDPAGARDAHHDEPPARAQGGRARLPGRRRRPGPARESLARHGGIIVAADREDAMRRWPTSPPRSISCVTMTGSRLRYRLPGRSSLATVHGTGCRRLRDRIEPCAADQRRGAVPGRPAHVGFRARCRQFSG